jgi:hypothetical protein
MIGHTNKDGEPLIIAGLMVVEQKDVPDNIMIVSHKSAEMWADMVAKAQAETADELNNKADDAKKGQV